MRAANPPIPSRPDPQSPKYANKNNTVPKISRIEPIIFLTFSTIWLISKTQRGGFTLDTILLKIPVFGALIEQSILNKFCKNPEVTAPTADAIKNIEISVIVKYESKTHSPSFL